MPFHFKCPYCATELEAQDEWVGLQTTCPGCRKSITITSAAAVPARPPVKLVVEEREPVSVSPENSRKPISRNVAPAAGSFPFVCPACGSLAELDSSLLNQEYECPECCEKSIAVPADVRPCPHCGQMIKFQARICRFCKKTTEIRQSGGGSAQKTSPSRSRGNGLGILVNLLIILSILIIGIALIAAAIVTIFF